MILTSDVIDILKSRLDASDGTDFYDFTYNYKPAINSAIEWIISVMNEALDNNKVTSEVLKELQVVRIFQVSNLSRFRMEGLVWSIQSVNPLPKAINNVNPDTPVTFFPSSESSIQRDDLKYVYSNYAAKRLTIEEWQKNASNPYAPGNTIVNCSTLEHGSRDNVYFAYLAPFNYKTVTRDEYEIEVRPYIPNKLCAIFYIEIPSPINAENSPIPFHRNLKNMLVEKALQFISYEQGDQTNLFAVTEKDINTFIKIFS